MSGDEDKGRSWRKGLFEKDKKEGNAERLDIRSEDIAQMATAADMDNHAVVTKTYKPFTVTALVTAGAKTNALRTGVDEGTHIEGEEPKGAVNILNHYQCKAYGRRCCKGNSYSYRGKDSSL